MVYTETLESPRLFRKETLNSTQGKKSHSFGLVLLTFVLAPTKVDPTVKEQSCKWGTAVASDAGDINMILALLKGVIGRLEVWDDWLQPGGTNPCRTLSLFEEGLPRCTCRKLGWGLDLIHCLV